MGSSRYCDRVEGSGRRKPVGKEYEGKKKKGRSVWRSCVSTLLGGDMILVIACAQCFLFSGSPGSHQNKGGMSINRKGV